MKIKTQKKAKKNKGYIHIVEYDLTKLILDKLDIDNDDECGYQLSLNLENLMYKDKYVIFPPYDKCLDYESKEIKDVVFKPFTSADHAGYLMNLFSHIKNYENIKFEYGDREDGTLTGTLSMSNKKKGKKQFTFNGFKNMSILQSALLFKAIMGSEMFSKYIGKMFKVDKKLTERKEMNLNGVKRGSKRSKI